MPERQRKASDRAAAVEAVVRSAQSRAKKHLAFQKEHAPSIAEKIVEALVHQRFLSKSVAKEVAFHLTDWIADLSELNELFTKNEWNAETSQRTIVNFVAHAPNHLAAAHRILFGDPLTDTFEIGAVKGSGRAKRKPGAAYTNQDYARSQGR